MKKISLDNPLYKIDRASLLKDLPILEKREFNRFIRRRVPLFMDEYRYAIAAVKARWGLDVYFFEAGHEQVKPVWLDKTLNHEAAALWTTMMDENKKFSQKIVHEMQDIIKHEKKLSQSVPDRKLSPAEIEKFIIKHLEWWVWFFEIGFLWFASDDIKQKTDAELKNFWKGMPESLAAFLEAVYRPMDLPPSSVEQRDLLKLVPLKGAVLKKFLAKHIARYRHLSLHNIDDEFFDREYYLNRIKTFKNSPEEFNKTKVVLAAADAEATKADKLLAVAELPAWIKDRINFVRWFMYLRTASVDWMMKVNGAYKPVITSFAETFKLKQDEVLHMTVEEIIASVRGKKLSISKEVIKDRAENGYAYLIAPHGSYLATGDEIDELLAAIIKLEKTDSLRQIKGQVAFPGKVTSQARVILDRRNAKELRDGEILVTTMTSPEFVPAMKKAAGIVTNEGGILCHAAIMSRELGKPCVIGTKIATDAIKTGQKIILDADNGTIYL